MLALRQHSWTLAAPCGSPTLWCLSGAQRLSYGFWDVCLRPIPAATGGALYGSGWRSYGAADRGCDVLLLRPRRGAAAWAPRERPLSRSVKHQSRLGSGIRRGQRQHAHIKCVCHVCQRLDFIGARGGATPVNHGTRQRPRPVRQEAPQTFTSSPRAAAYLIRPSTFGNRPNLMITTPPLPGQRVYVIAIDGYAWATLYRK